jgi:uncharacterized membrane protein YjjP (DUF1212 family)
MDELTTRPHPYPRWIATVGWAGFALGIAMLFGGSWLTCLLAAVTSAVIDRVNRRLHRIGTPLFFQQAVGAFFATLVAVAAYLYANQGPTALVATGIVMLLSGLTLVGSVQDALTGYMLTAVARLGDVLFMTAGIVVGILAGLQVAALADITITLHVDATETFITPRGSGPIALAVSGAALAGACLTIVSYARLRAVATAGVVAGVAELALIGLASTGFGQVVATGVAAAGVGLLATLSSIRRQAPALVTATAGITPMLPGLAVFRAVFYFAVDKDYAHGIPQALAAAATALAIGAGVVLGELLGSPLRYRAGRLGKLLHVRGAPGVRRAVGRAVRLQPADVHVREGADAERTVSVALELVPVSEDDTADSGESPDDESRDSDASR